jgi:chromosomal replication initiation ATPase DnaA
VSVAPFIEPLPDLDRVLDVVAKFFNLKKSWFFQKVRERQRTVIRARMLTCWLLYRHSSLSYDAIGRFLQRDHSTVVSAVQKVDAAFQRDEQLREYVKKLRTELGFG